jgi:hypothetical protein
MFLSIITTWGFYETSEMLIPQSIGEELQGFSRLNRLDRRLPVGHRFHGYAF